MAYLKQIKIKGVIGGIGTFVVLYLLYSYLTTLSVRANIGTDSQLYITLRGYLVWLMTGYMAGFFSKIAGIINGAIAGSLTPIVMIFIMAIGFGSWAHVQESVKDHGLFWVFAGFFICGIGGLIWDIQQRILRK